MRAAPAPVAMATRGTSGPAESQAAPANYSCYSTPALTVPAGETRATLASSPHFPSAAAERSPTVFLKGTLPLGDNDAGRGGKSHRRMGRGVRLHDLTNLKLRRRTGLYSATPFAPRVPLRAPCTLTVAQVFGSSGPARKGSDRTIDGGGTVCVASPGKIRATHE